MRIFIGMKPDDCLDEILAIQRHFRDLPLTGNYTLPDNIHMTLAFLGELDNSAVALVKTALKQIDYPAFLIHIDKITNLRDMMILKIRRDPELLRLQGGICRALARLDIKMNRRSFYPHITLIRKCDFPVDKPVDLTTEAREVILFSSERVNGRLSYVPFYRKVLRRQNA